MTRLQKIERNRLDNMRMNAAQKLRAVAGRLRELGPYFEVERVRDGLNLEVPEDLKSLVPSMLGVATDLEAIAASLVEEQEAARDSKYEHGAAIHEEIKRRTELKRMGLLP